MGEFGRRILFAVPAAAGFLWITWLGGWWFTGLMALIAIAVTVEMALLFHHIHHVPARGMRIAASVALFGVVVAMALQFGWPLDVLLAILFAVFIPLYGAVQGGKADQWLSLPLTGLYAPTAFLLADSLRRSGSNSEGFFLVLALFLGIWGNDVFAYLGGKQFGRHKLAPSISPGKTWEGWAFGFLGAALGWGAAVWFGATVFASETMAAGGSAIPADGSPVSAEMIATWPMILIVSVLGPLGDLMESRLKRRSGRKDSGSILPGHGGFFDRFDAMILVTPAVWLFLKWMELI